MWGDLPKIHRGDERIHDRDHPSHNVEPGNIGREKNLSAHPEVKVDRGNLQIDGNKIP